MNTYLHGAVWLLMSMMYAPVFFQLYQSRWEAIDYTHAYFILPVSLWMAWRKRAQLAELARRLAPAPDDMLGLGAAIVGFLMFFFGWRQSFLLIMSLSLIPVLWGTVRYLYGAPVAKAVLFPILYLLFLVPPPLGILDNITLPMRYAISDAAYHILRVFDYPIVKNGLMLTMKQDDIFMGAPCSGFRSLITMMALTVAYVSFIKGDRAKKLILVASGIPLALFGNLIRVMGMCLMTYYAGHEAAEGLFHDSSGMIIFLVMIGGLMGTEHLLDKHAAGKAVR